MKTRTIGSGQGGFTLIEVIAVLVIVGMLAAVAIPRYLDMQDQAAVGAVKGALAAGASNVTMVYSQQLIAGNFNLTNLVANLSTAPYNNVGDFTLAYAANTANNSTGVDVSVTASSVNSINQRIGNMNATDKGKTIVLQ
jgi:prepilin-type N-terminal cleavage/methylation domain-containing protein